MIEAMSAMRDLPRLREITSVMIRYGFGDVMQRIGVLSLLERAGQILHRPAATEERVELDTPQRIRQAMEELGPTFIKLGQVMATRVDIFPPGWIAEFEKLQNNVPPVPFEVLLPQVEQALGRSPFEIFSDLETTPCGSASIAQVHRAKLADGTPVVLKIRRPGIQAKIDADLRILRHIAALLEMEIPEARRYQPGQLVKEFGRSLQRELDLAQEASTQERFIKNYAADPHIVIPHIYWEWCSPGMNVQQYIAGVPGNDLAAVDASGLDRKLLAQRGADAVLKMILLDGYFHADPHPGNVFYLPDNRIAMLDFGMVGRLSEIRRTQIVEMLSALAQRDEQLLLDVLLEWTDDADVDEAKLVHDINELIFTYEYVPLRDLSLGAVLGEITSIMREHHIVLPTDLVLLFKALITLEGLGRQLDPDLRMVDHIEPFLKIALVDRYSPSALLKRGKRSVHDIFSVLSGLPRDVARLVKEARRGRVKIDLDIKRLDHFGHQLDRSSNRLTMGVLTASLFIASSIVMTVERIPVWVGLFGYLIAFANSLFIVLSIWRSNRE
ncbi:MAG: ubiquinone biosynthesis protein UbiB [Nitrosomonadales bacterium]|nr:ubiquinone biosynthesis protein UbiB [Nitrosomonadales bacterium]